MSTKQLDCAMESTINGIFSLRGAHVVMSAFEKLKNSHVHLPNLKQIFHFIFQMSVGLTTRRPADRIRLYRDHFDDAFRTIIGYNARVWLVRLLANKTTLVVHVVLLDAAQKPIIHPTKSSILHTSVLCLRVCAGPDVAEL